MNYKHGIRKHKLYSVWRNIKTRCYNPNTHNYSNYGGKGIKMCQQWINDAQAFYDWSMSNGYKPTLTLDRRDSSKDYCPSNCRWTTLLIQQRNKSKRKNTASKFIGVGIHKNKSEIGFNASVRVNKKLIYFGRFKSESEAAMARDRYIIENRLVGYKLNF